MQPPRPGRPFQRLDIGDAVHEGWLAFGRAPWAFVGFTLLLTALQALCQPLMERVRRGEQVSGDPMDWLLYLVGLAASVTINLWGAAGLVRGSWSALEGGHPRLSELLRWDGAALRRLLTAWLLLAALMAVPVVGATVLLGVPLVALAAFGDNLGAFRPLLTALLAVLLIVCLAVVLVVVLYLSVNQQFLAQIAVLEVQGPRATLQRGRRLVDPQWLLALLLNLVEGLLALLGLLACLVGFFVAWPVITCVSTAAYRQLRDREEAAV